MNCIVRPVPKCANAEITTGYQPSSFNWFDPDTKEMCQHPTSVAFTSFGLHCKSSFIVFGRFQKSVAGKTRIEVSKALNNKVNALLDGRSNLDPGHVQTT
jgi:hypothetical protein